MTEPEEEHFQEQRKDPAKPPPLREFIPPTQPRRQHAQTSPRTWQRVSASSLLPLPNSPSFSIRNPEPPTVSVKSWDGAEGSSCRFYFGTARSAALTLIRWHPPPRRPCSAHPCCEPAVLTAPPPGSWKVPPLLFTRSQIPFLKDWLVCRCFTNTNYCSFTWTLLPSVTAILNPLQLSVARGKAETPAAVFLKVFVTAEHRVKQSHHFCSNYSDYFEYSCKKLINIDVKSRARHFQSLSLAYEISHNLHSASHFCTERGWIIGFLGLRHHGNRFVHAAESALITTQSCYVALGKLRVSVTQFTHCNNRANSSLSFSEDHLWVDFISSTLRAHKPSPTSLTHHTMTQEEFWKERSCRKYRY